ncbi:hypothetical protein AB0M58_14510 [Streptomyces bobili]|uniref:hypothetical protein n=1 Tax=Streptomyces bobili TaxID=67280 RepID=UPI00343DD1C6
MGTSRRTSASGLDARARARELSAGYAKRETQLQDLATRFLEIREECDRQLAGITGEMEALGCGIPEIGERVDEPTREIRRLKALAPSGGTKASRAKNDAEAPPQPPHGPARLGGQPPLGERPSGVAAGA